jgi:hypothetical protein
MDAEVLIFDHDASRLWKRLGGKESLFEVVRWSREACSKVFLLAILSNCQALDWTHVDARVALDTELRDEIRLDVAIQASLNLTRRLLGGES